MMERSDKDWGAGSAVAETIAKSLAVFAAFLSDKEIIDDTLMCFLDQLSIDLDSFSTNLFGGLRRLERGDGESSGELQNSLQAICLWAIIIIAHILGSNRLSSLVLWEWVWKDPLWACVLVKGFLSALDSGEEQPAAMAEIKESVLEAFMGLTSPSIAFATKGSTESISVGNEELIRHYSRLAVALASSCIVKVLLRVENSVCGLASFLATLLQPEILGDDSRCWSSRRAAAIVLLGGDSPTAPATIKEAKAAATSLRAELEKYKDEFWRKLTFQTSSSAFEVQTSFLRSCVQLSYFFPLDMECLRSFVAATLHFTSPTGSDKDAALLVMLCFVAANSGAYPEHLRDLVCAVGNTSAEVKTAMDSRWERWLWQGCCQMDILAQWIAELELAKMPKEDWQQFPDHVTTELTDLGFSWRSNPSDQSHMALEAGNERTPPAPTVPKAGRLQELVLDAPQLFQCAISSQLMMDPVQTPEALNVTALQR